MVLIVLLSVLLAIITTCAYPKTAVGYPILGPARTTRKGCQFNLSQQGTGSAILYQIAYDNREIVSETSWRNLINPQSILEGLRQINKKAESVSEHLDAVLGPCPSILEHLRNCHGLLRNCLGITSGLLGIAQGLLRDCLGIAKHCLGIASGLPWDLQGLPLDCLGIALRLLRIAQGLLRNC